MQLKYILPAALLSACASAGPIRRSADLWQVSNFSTGCSPGGCVFTFNIFSTNSSNAPGFNTSCEGTDVAGKYQACTDPAVSANLLPYTYPYWGVAVQHEWSTDSGRFYAQGLKNVTSGTTSFIIPVTHKEGVA